MSKYQLNQKKLTCITDRFPNFEKDQQYRVAIEERLSVFIIDKDGYKKRFEKEEVPRYFK